MKQAVPICTAFAPARRNSRASDAVAIPPMPITGTVTAEETLYTIARATGLMAGPDNPPKMLESLNLLLFISMAVPTSVFIRETASAPAASCL